jgi:hypothetical protein
MVCVFVCVLACMHAHVMLHCRCMRLHASQLCFAAGDRGKYWGHDMLRECQS